MNPRDEDEKALAKQVEGVVPQEDPWRALAALTPARLGLGRIGAAQRTATHLAFQADHAFARDAVHTPFSADGFAAGLTERLGVEVVAIASQAANRQIYLRRPGLGRRLSAASRAVLEGAAGDVSILICDGLSSTAVERHAEPLVGALVEALTAMGLSLAPITVASHGRVALGDPVGEALRARVSVVVIGERPGLSAADSLGIYLTYGPISGRTDAERNCISNVHPPDGLDYTAAVHKAVWLVRAALERGYSGVHLKDESDVLRLAAAAREADAEAAVVSSEEAQSE